MTDIPKPGPSKNDQILAAIRAITKIVTTPHYGFDEQKRALRSVGEIVEVVLHETRDETGKFQRDVSRVLTKMKPETMRAIAQNLTAISDEMRFGQAELARNQIESVSYIFRNHF
jgi:hypothetical protein